IVKDLAAGPDLINVLGRGSVLIYRKDQSPLGGDGDGGGGGDPGVEQVRHGLKGRGVFANPARDAGVNIAGAQGEGGGKSGVESAAKKPAATNAGRRMEQIMRGLA